ncbi:MAG: MaoC family dehydratase N-terminal domain-containing protein [Deltaproteobacteria bacterium]|nr:MaoC family dehydratase N-terminal domain-containing protein [Deltaproteobacteria bacterium]
MHLNTAGLYYEDFSVGCGFVSAARVIAPADVETFSRLTRDANPIHTDAAHMSTHPLGRPVVHGMLVAALGVGLIAELGLTRGTLVAMLAQHIEYKSPVYVGDTVHVKMEVIDKRDTRHPSRGIVTYRYEIMNDANVIAVVGTNTNMVFRKNALNQNGDEK